MNFIIIVLIFILIAFIKFCIIDGLTEDEFNDVEFISSKSRKRSRTPPRRRSI